MIATVRSLIIANPMCKNIHNTIAMTRVNRKIVPGYYNDTRPTVRSIPGGVGGEGTAGVSASGQVVACPTSPRHKVTGPQLPF